MWRTLRPALMAAVNVVVALIVIFEEWGWQPLARALAWFARFRPIAALERWIAGLPPYGALAVFALPMTLLFPLKLVAVWLLANGHVLGAGALFIGAKLASTAFVARIFMLVKPSLLRIGWFARAYASFVPWEQAAAQWLRASWAWRMGRVVKVQIKRGIADMKRRLGPRIAAALDDLRRRWPLWRRTMARQAGIAVVSARDAARRVIALLSQTKRL